MNTIITLYCHAYFVYLFFSKLFCLFSSLTIYRHNVHVPSISLYSPPPSSLVPLLSSPPFSLPLPRFLAINRVITILSCLMLPSILFVAMKNHQLFMFTLSFTHFPHDTSRFHSLRSGHGIYILQMSTNSE